MLNNTARTKKCLCLALVLTCTVSVLLQVTRCAAAPVVSNVSASSNSVEMYSVVAVDFDVATAATNYFWPYDPSPPPSIPAGVGVTVDGLFSNDNWATTVTVPAFYYQDYERRLSGDPTNWMSETVTPVGKAHWRVRFAPTRTGEWQFKIRVTDSSGTVEAADTTAYRFQCVSSNDPGFCRTSAADPRYFELSNGSPLLGPGINAHFHTTYEADSLLSACGSSGVRLVRWWMDSREWQNPFGGTEMNPSWSFLLTLSNVGGCKAGDRYCGLLSAGRDTHQIVYLQAGLLYRLTGRLRTEGVSGNPGTGAVIYIAGSSSNAVSGTNDWQTLTVDRSPSTSGVALVGCKHTGSAGTVYFDDMSLKYSADGGRTWSSECLSKGDFDFQNYVDLAEAWKVDRVFEAAKANGVYLKTVISEKQDYTLGCIAADGSTVARSDSNFYASANHPSRWLQKAWWRYMTARWGCYTSLHSWELCNEGDPFNGDHYNAADALASYVHSVDPNKAMCTTSFWHSIPMEFWKASACDYLDVHEYIGPVTPGTGSHGPRLYAWYDPIQTSGNTMALLPLENDTGIVSLDSTQRHSGSKSVKVLAKAGGNGWGWGQVSACPYYHVGINPAHTYAFRFWARADNVGVLSSALAWTRPGLHITWSAVYAENDFVSQRNIDAPLGTYDWQQITVTGVAPPTAANTMNIAIVSTCSPDRESSFWIDDLEVIDETTGASLFVDGGFEGDRIDYDTALAVKKYGVLLNSYASRVAKPAIWGETGIRGPNELGSPYKGYAYTEENQRLVDDTSGLYLKKMIWAHVGPDNPNMLLWWTENIAKKGLWHYFKAFQDFMSGIPVSNGHYKDAEAVTSTPVLRAWGQKDLTNNRAHLWIDNAPYTWKNVVDGVSVPAVSGTVTLTGLKDGSYQVEWWDTSTGAVTRTEFVDCANGSLVLSVTDLQSDIACKLRPRPASIAIRVLVSPAQPAAGETVTVTVEYSNLGESEANNVIVTARVPVGMRYIEGSADAGGTFDPAKGEVSWIVNSVAAHETGTRSFKAVVE